MTDADVVFMPYSLSISSHISSSLLRQSLSIHQQHHCHSSPYCPFFVILIMTGFNSLTGTIPTEIGQLTVLTSLYLRKYDGCLSSFHALFFIYKLTYFVLFSPLIALNSPTTPLSFIAILSIFCDSYYNRC
jgi:surface polysaccharide O-acyltransferase-like enzyme